MHFSTSANRCDDFGEPERPHPPSAPIFELPESVISQAAQKYQKKNWQIYPGIPGYHPPMHNRGGASGPRTPGRPRRPETARTQRGFDQSARAKPTLKCDTDSQSFWGRGQPKKRKLAEASMLVPDSGLFSIHSHFGPACGICSSASSQFVRMANAHPPIQQPHHGPVQLCSPSLDPVGNCTAQPAPQCRRFHFLDLTGPSGIKLLKLNFQGSKCLLPANK
jgi:hypothetical protein